MSCKGPLTPLRCSVIPAATITRRLDGRTRKMTANPTVGGRTRMMMSNRGRRIRARAGRIPTVVVWILAGGIRMMMWSRGRRIRGWGWILGRRGPIQDRWERGQLSMALKIRPNGTTKSLTLIPRTVIPTVLQTQHQGSRPQGHPTQLTSLSRMGTLGTHQRVTRHRSPDDARPAAVTPMMMVHLIRPLIECRCRRCRCGRCGVATWLSCAHCGAAIWACHLGVRPTSGLSVARYNRDTRSHVPPRIQRIPRGSGRMMTGVRVGTLRPCRPRA